MKVIETVDQSDVVEMELKGRKFAMTVRKQEALQAQEPIYVTSAPAAAAGAQPLCLLTCMQCTGHVAVAVSRTNINIHMHEISCASPCRFC